MFLGAFLLLLTLPLAYSKKLPNVYWNSSNPIFDISNTDHVIPVDIDDRLSIFCPAPSVFYEYSSIYMVTEEEYTHCVLLQQPHLIGLCSNSTTEVSFGIVFRRHSPIPGGLQFTPGKNYYMITTSDGTREGMDRKKGGLCAERQMKIKFEVVDRKTTNPRFAASIQNSRKAEEPPKSTTPVMYIIHTDDTTELDDLDADNGPKTGVSLLIFTLCCIFYLL